MRVYLTIAGIVLAFLLVILQPWSDNEASSNESPEVRAFAPADRQSEPTHHPINAHLPKRPLIDLQRSPLADDLNQAEGSIQQDLATVLDLFAHYRLVLGENPTGSNDEITAALSGTNKRLFAPLPRDHQAINKNGELADRWETPFFFHSLSAEFLEVRSAGPDRILWTDDDETLSNAPPKLAL